MTVIYYLDELRFIKECRKRSNKIDLMRWYSDTDTLHCFINTDNEVYSFDCPVNDIPEPVKMLLNEDGQILGIRTETVNVKIENQVPVNKLRFEDGRLL